MSEPVQASKEIANQLPGKHQYVRVTILCHRNPKLTEEEFHKHWSTTHAQKASAHLERYGIVSYKQYHSTSKLRDLLVKAMPSIGGEIDKNSMISDYDGHVELLMPNLDCYQRAIEDEYYKNVIAPDEQEFADWSSSKLTVGWEEVYIQNGKVVNLKN